MALSRIEGGYLKFLSDEEVELIHEASLKILATTGVIIDNSQLQKVFSDKGGTVVKEENILYFGKFSGKMRVYHC